MRDLLGVAREKMPNDTSTIYGNTSLRFDSTNDLPRFRWPDAITTTWFLPLSGFGVGLTWNLYGHELGPLTVCKIISSENIESTTGIHARHGSPVWNRRSGSTPDRTRSASYSPRPRSGTVAGFAPEPPPPRISSYSGLRTFKVTLKLANACVVLA